MLQKVEKKEHNQVELEFTVSKEVFDAACTRAFKKNAPKMNVPGFRRGKAPRHIIEKMYGTGVFYDEALNDVLPDAYTAAVDEAKLEVVSRPEFDVLSIDENGVVFKAVLYVMPEVSLSSYKGLTAEKTVKKATEADVAAELDRVRSRNSRQIDVTDRPVAKDDTAVIDFEGFIDGVAFDGGKGEDYSLKIGSGSFIPGFEDQLVGAETGADVDVNVTFPEQYHADNLAGKDAVFHVKVNGIQTKVRPELDDDFAADVSEFDTFEAYKANIVADLEKNAADRAEANLEDALVQKVVDAADCDIPDAMIQDEITTMLREMEMRMMYQGIRFEDYLKYTGQTLDQVRENYKPEAANRVKTQLVLEAVAKAENIVPTDEDVDEAIADQAKRVNRDVEEFKASLSEQQKEYLKETAGIKKVIDFLKANAVITEKAAEEKAE